jgi:hypothetical protein
MSMVCKQWEAIALDISRKYKTMRAAIHADSSIAITRILQEGAAMGGSTNLYLLPERDSYLARGNSIAFARAIPAATICSMAPYYFASRRGLKYARWLMANSYNKLHEKEELFEAFTRGDVGAIKKIEAEPGRREGWATILYTNGHYKLCWPPNKQEKLSILMNAELLSQEALSSVLSYSLEQVPMPYSAVHKMTMDQLRACFARGNFCEDTYVAYMCDTYEKYEFLKEMNVENIFTTDGVHWQFLTDARRDFCVSRTQRFDLVSRRTMHITVYPENYARVCELFPGRIECVVGHSFIIHPAEGGVEPDQA